MICTIYRFTNLITGKQYYGSTIVDPQIRYNQHIYNATHSENPKYNYPLYCSMRKRGFDNYKFEIVEQKVNWLGATGVIGYITYRAIDLHTSDTINAETIEFIETVEKVFIP